MKKYTSIIIAILIPAISMIVALTLVFMKKNAKIEDAATLPIERYMSSAKSFAGNSYTLNVIIDSQLGYDESSGRIILVKASNNSFIPVLVPSSNKDFIPQTGQKYSFDVKIDQDGKLILTSYKKI